EGVAQRTRNRLLPDDVVELLRPPFARDDLVHWNSLTAEPAETTEAVIVLRTGPRPGRPAAHFRIHLALLPSGPDAVRRLKLHRFRTAVQFASPLYYTGTCVARSRYFASTSPTTTVKKST